MSFSWPRTDAFTDYTFVTNGLEKLTIINEFDKPCVAAEYGVSTSSLCQLIRNSSCRYTDGRIICSVTSNEYRTI